MSSGRSIPFTDYLYKRLEDPEFAVGYLSATLQDYDRAVFLTVLRDIITAREGNVTKLAERTGLSREHLYRMLSPRGNPTLANFLALLEVLDFQLSIEQRSKPKRKTKRKAATKKPAKRAPSSKRLSPRPSAR